MLNRVTFLELSESCMWCSDSYWCKHVSIVTTNIRGPRQRERIAITIHESWIFGETPPCIWAKCPTALCLEHSTKGSSEQDWRKFIFLIAPSMAIPHLHCHFAGLLFVSTQVDFTRNQLHSLDPSQSGLSLHSFLTRMLPRPFADAYPRRNGLALVSSLGTFLSLSLSTSLLLYINNWLWCLQLVRLTSSLTSRNIATEVIFKSSACIFPRPPCQIRVTFLFLFLPLFDDSWFSYLIISRHVKGPTLLACVRFLPYTHLSLCVMTGPLSQIWSSADLFVLLAYAIANISNRCL